MSDDWWDFADDELELLDPHELRSAHERALAEVHPADESAGVASETAHDDPDGVALTPAERVAVDHAHRVEERYRRIRLAWDRRHGSSR